MFKTIEDLVIQAESRGMKLWQMMLEQEMEESDKSEEKILAAMRDRYHVMQRAIRLGITGVHARSGLTGGDAKKLHDHLLSGNCLTDTTFLKAVCYAMATNEVNASMGVVCATPTAGSSGVLPGVLEALREARGFSEEQMLQALLTAGAIGFVIANNAFISGAAGGCQAEVGSAAAMAAAAVVELCGGSPRQAAQAMAMAMKNLLGLTCDPVAGLVEVPCVKRNAGGASIALSAAEMALAGVQSRIPPDEVISAMHAIGQALPEALRETALGGLAMTPTGRAWTKALRGDPVQAPSCEWPPAI